MYDFLFANWPFLVIILIFPLVIRMNLAQHAKLRQAQADNAKAVIAAIERVAAALEKK